MAAKTTVLLNLFIIVAGIFISCNGNQNEIPTNNEQPSEEGLFNKILQTMIVVHAKTGRYEDARKELGLLKDYENEIKPIVSMIYSRNATESADHLAYFLIVNNSCPVFANGIEAWFENMQKYNDLSNPEVIVLSYVANIGCHGNNKVRKLRTEIKPFVDEILAPWAVEIRNGNGQSIYPFIKSSTIKGNAVRKYLPQMIKMTFSGNSTENLNSVLRFVWKLPSFQDDVVGYWQIIKELKEMGKEYSEEMLLTCYWIHQRMSKSEEIIADIPDLRQDYNRVKNEIPASIQNIFWENKSCRIKNLDRSEYLVGVETESNDNGDVFTTSEWKIGQASGWDLIRHVVDGQLLFFVSNSELHRQRNLCKKDLELKTCNHEHALYGEQQDRWIFIPVEGNETGNAFLIQNYENKGENYYISATDTFKDADNIHRRSVIISSSESGIHWNIDCS